MYFARIFYPSNIEQRATIGKPMCIAIKEFLSFIPFNTSSWRGQKSRNRPYSIFSLSSTIKRYLAMSLLICIHK